MLLQHHGLKADSEFANDCMFQVDFQGPLKISCV